MAHFFCNAVAASLLFGWEVLARSKQPSLDAKEENVDQVHSADVMGCNICMRLGHWDEGAHGITEEQTRIFPGSLHNTKGHELRQEAPTHKDTSNPRAELGGLSCHFCGCAGSFCEPSAPGRTRGAQIGAAMII